MGYEEFAVDGDIVDDAPTPDGEQPSGVTAESLGLALPDDPVDAVPVLVDALAEARRDAGSYLDDLKRVAADFDNFRKRAMRDQQTTVARAAERVVSAMLPVLDSFDAALAIEPTSAAEEKMLGGMRSTQAQLLDVLSKEGLAPIHALGERFDPELHEAVMSTGGDDLVVVQELRRGYTLGGRVLRASLVGLGEAGGA